MTRTAISPRLAIRIFLNMLDRYICVSGPRHDCLITARPGNAHASLMAGVLALHFTRLRVEQVRLLAHGAAQHGVRKALALEVSEALRPVFLFAGADGDLPRLADLVSVVQTVYFFAALDRG